MLKIIHGADFHLDAPFAALSPEQAAQRRAEQRQDAVPGKERLDALVRHMREEQKKPERPDWAAR